MSTKIIQAAEKLQTALAEFLKETNAAQSEPKPDSPNFAQIENLREALVRLAEQDKPRAKKLFDDYGRRKLEDMTPDELLNLAVDVGLE